MNRNLWWKSAEYKINWSRCHFCWRYGRLISMISFLQEGLYCIIRRNPKKLIKTILGVAIYLIPSIKGFWLTQILRNVGRAKGGFGLFNRI